VRARSVEPPVIPASRPNRWVAPLIWVTAAIVAASQAWAGLSRPWSDRLSDLQVYLGGVNSWKTGGSLYDFAAAGTGAPFTYPPFAGLVFYPFAYLNTTVLMVMWTIATVVAVVVMARIVGKSASEAWQAPLKVAMAGSALLLFLAAPVSSNMRFGQVSIFLVLLVLLDTMKIVPPKFNGVAIGLASALKLTPLIFIPYLWMAGQRRAAINALGTFVVASGLTWLVLFDESMRYWTVELRDVERVGNIATGGNQSINGALLRLDYPDSVRTAAVLVIGGALVAVALWRASQMAKRGRLLAATVVVGAASLVFSPVSWTHHQVWLVLAALVPVSLIVARNWAWSALVAALMVLPVTSVGANLPGGVIWGNIRLVLAVLIVCLMPVAGRGGTAAEVAGVADPAEEDGRAETGVVSVKHPDLPESGENHSQGTRRDPVG
jgi:alpha-1,2-mannosyltransferase